MVEARRFPGEAVVARAAIQIRGDVIGGFARRPNVVVAGGAAAANFGMRKTRGGHKRGGGVTSAAIVGAWNVGGRFGGRRDSRTLRVAAVAIARCSFEYSVDVTRFARLLAMRAGEFEAGRQVIEIARG